MRETDSGRERIRKTAGQESVDGTEDTAIPDYVLIDFDPPEEPREAPTSPVAREKSRHKRR